MNIALVSKIDHKRVNLGIVYCLSLLYQPGCFATKQGMDAIKLPGSL